MGAPVDTRAPPPGGGGGRECLADVWKEKVGRVPLSKQWPRGLLRSYTQSVSCHVFCATCVCAAHPGAKQHALRMLKRSCSLGMPHTAACDIPKTRITKRAYKKKVTGQANASGGHAHKTPPTLPQGTVASPLKAHTLLVGY